MRPVEKKSINVLDKSHIKAHMGSVNKQVYLYRMAMLKNNKHAHRRQPTTKRRNMANKLRIIVAASKHALNVSLIENGLDEIYGIPPR